MDMMDVSGCNQYMTYHGSVMNAADMVRVPDMFAREGRHFNMDEVEIYSPTPLEIRQSWWPYFVGQGANPAVSDIFRDVYGAMDEAAGKYLDGSMSDQQLSDTFTKLLTRLSDGCRERNYPVPGAGGADGEQALADSFFDTFRKKILDEAVDRNYNEGLQHASNGKSGNWLYYNANYYHKAESAISALTSSVINYCHEKGYDDFTITPRRDHWKLKAVDYNYYEDFNGAWEDRFGSVHSNNFISKDQTPPKDFIWFYETGGTFGPGQIAMIPEHKVDGVGFDPTDFLSARMWVSYRDANGNLHRSETIFSYDYDWTPSNLKVVDALLSFPGLEKDDALHKYLKNLQVFALGHFDQHPSVRVDTYA